MREVIPIPQIHGRLITHNRCLDGATAALIGETAGLLPVFVEPDGVVQALAAESYSGPTYLADVSVPESAWDVYGPQLTWVLDHHETALPLARFPRTTIDMDRCGCHLLYDFAVEHGWIVDTPEWKRLVQEVEAYDLWKPTRQVGQDIKRLFYEFGYGWYRQAFATGWRPWTDEEASTLARLIEEERVWVKQHVEAAEWRRCGPWNLAGAVLESEGALNEVAHQLINDGAHVVLLVKFDGTFSARSVDPINVARLMADRFGGGGHAHAAGARIPAGMEPSTEALHWGFAQLTPDLAARAT